LTLPTSKTVGTPLKVQYNESRKPYAHFLIYGKTKAGKTTCANTLESDPARNAIISTQPPEQLAHISQKTPYVVTPTYEDLKYALEHVEQLFPNVGTLIIDDFSEACALMRATVNGSDNKYKPYGDGAIWAGTVLRSLLHKPFNLVLTAFERQDSDGTSAESTQWVCPDFPNATAAAINAKMDFIMRTSDYKLRVKEDKARRVMAGNRWPVAKLSLLKDEVEPNLAKLWASYLEVIS